MVRSFAFIAAFAFALGARAGDFQLHVDGPLTVRNSFHGYGCTGENIRPTLRWSDAPARTRSFAVTVFDPDAPTGSGWWHWAVIDLPAGTRTLSADAALPAGARALRNDYGQTSWGGPCPPAGDPPHHYVFTVYALDVTHLGVPATASPALAGFAIHAHTLGHAQETLTWGR